jgi:hypothetical protein
MAGSLKKHIQIAKRNTKITPRLHGWLSNNPDGIKIADKAIATRVLEILSPSEGDRSGAFHPSQLYQCKRAQIFDYYGVEHPKSYNPTLQNLFNDGHFRHLRWQIMLLNAGILTDVEVGIQIPEKRLVGSMDGMNADEGWMFELKGTSQYAEVVRRGAMPEHVKQVNAYLLASGLESALIVYECKSSQNWIEIEVQRDDKIASEINKILDELNQAIDSGNMPEVYSDCQNQTGPRYNRCKYNSICLGIKSTEDITPVLPPQRRSADAGRDAKGTKRVQRRAPRKSRTAD